MPDHTFYRNTPALLQAVDNKGHLLEVSNRWLHWLGYERCAVVGAHFEDFLCEETRQRVHALMIPELVKGSEVIDFEGNYRHAPGKMCSVLILATAVRNENDHVDHALLVLTDISERKQAERQLMILSEGTANVVGGDYFRSLASHLADAFAVRFVSVEHSFMGRAVMTHQPVVIHNLSSVLQNDRDLDLSLQRRQILAGLFKTLLAVPLVRKGQSDEIYGGIALYFPEQRNFSDEEVQLAVAFAGQASLVLENAQLRAGVEQMAVMEERNRLARKLHDSVTQSLYSLTLLAEGRRRMTQNGQLDHAESAFAELSEIGQQALREMRLLIHELRPPQLAGDGLWSAINQRLMAVERRAGTEVRLIADQMLDLPRRLEDGIYRIVQEALNNTLKHANASRVVVQIDVRAGMLYLTISDNGLGFEPTSSQSEGGIGINRMREQAEALGGRLMITSAPGKGTTVSMEAPV